ncbi:thiamine biosynthesis protein ThiJ [Nocardioides humilatus]|uniref:Thiamine biosynthesis protein ThiJ n=1 Tax=Nocardioides humilatus TaxID=2607660 RepID=A0A5B1LLV1_9ACTN|nr:type 1 glutamine amidotransferase domain-containing protein [Nocardioides humilatus]KAA1421474.1 thiamine biosynthesis protein ThiJ [Nocardioides humilatus]
MRVLVPLPDTDFDTTEVAVPWRMLTDAGHEVVFATEHGGAAPRCDERLLDGVLFGKLGAYPEPIEFYDDMITTDAFLHPLSWLDLDVTVFDGLLLAGGHAPGMRQYLGSAQLQASVARFWATGKPVGAICHGVLLLARSKDADGVSVLADRRTTCLPKYMERGGYLLTAWKLGRYYRTYPMYVEDEVIAHLASADQFERGPRETKRGTRTDHGPAFVVEDGNYVSARWPGDAYLFAERFMHRLG